ncbi:NAD kinase [Terasakiispira papahanaumokuakeensis]|uniref:NAD kinase n=1 Tax=Terasakiispira papahanaumokuakeensis TaxID=197479 RepID=A0A1E2V7D7_9GAMM|nr:NAD(+) kinase [Terasakiispira papahanaumokuakeensis]ODC02756.1 NAD kinase [Terasakiispira papahanaumokuakeensis]
MEQFKNIGLIGRLGSHKVVETLKRLIRFLEDRHYQVILEDQTATVLLGHGLQEASRKMLAEICDLVIVVGGDGSLLGAARAMVRTGVPVLGVNRGRLGFLTDISPDDLEEKVAEVLAGRYLMEERFLLDVEVRRDGEPIGTADGLNDVVLHPGKSARMIEFDLFIEGQYVYNQRSDGLIVATPTGSTAYALSGGGPIMHPKLDALVVVPMFPHTLSSRPIVVDGNSEIKLHINEHNETYPHISCDGQTHIVTKPGDWLYIRKKPHRLKLIHPLGHDYYEVCRTKLGWNSRLIEG